MFSPFTQSRRWNAEANMTAPLGAVAGQGAGVACGFCIEQQKDVGPRPKEHVPAGLPADHPHPEHVAVESPGLIFFGEIEDGLENARYRDRHNSILT